MNNVISEYQKWKQQGESLRVQAKQAMESRFRDLLIEAAQIAQEYHRDFGLSLKPPASITAFKFKSASGTKGKAVVKVAKPAVAPPVDPKVSALQKSRAQIMKKIDVTRAAGKPTRNLEDKLYVVDDELRLALETE
jgi:hypothetical protein